MIIESEQFTKGKQEGDIFQYPGTHKDVWDELYKSIAEAYYKEIPSYIADFCKYKLDKHAVF